MTDLKAGLRLRERQGLVAVIAGALLAANLPRALWAGMAEVPDLDFNQSSIGEPAVAVAGNAFQDSLVPSISPLSSNLDFGNQTSSLSNERIQSLNLLGVTPHHEQNFPASGIPAQAGIQGGIVSDGLGPGLCRGEGKNPVSGEAQSHGPKTLARIRTFQEGLNADDVQRMPLEASGDLSRRMWDGAGPSVQSPAVSLQAAKPHLPEAFEESARPVFVPAKKNSYRRVSIGRAFTKHAGRRWILHVFEVPLVSTEHQILVAFSLLIFPLISILLISPIILAFAFSRDGLGLAKVFVAIIIGWGICAGIKAAAGHYREARDAQGVVRNAKRYVQAPSTVAWDKDLLRVVQKFCKETGWSVAWTDDPYLLAQADKEKRQVVLSLGWVIKSADSRDARRLAYLTDTLRIIRHAIKAL